MLKKTIKSMINYNYLKNVVIYVVFVFFFFCNSVFKIDFKKISLIFQNELTAL